MSEISIQQAMDLVRDALVGGGGFEPVDAERIAVEFVSAEVAGTRTHGIGKVISLNFGDVKATPSYGGAGSLLVVDAHGGNGFLTLRGVAEEVAGRVTEHGVAVAFVRNFSRYSSLYPYTELLAARGFVALLSNAAGPAAVAPYGSVDPVTGTNPICFSFPTSEGIQTFDFATSDVVWGAIRQAALDNVDLPAGPFIDAEGKETVTPGNVNAVRAFGGVKGSALNLALELLTSGLVGASLGGAVESEFDLGAILLAFDPERTGATEFPARASRLFAEIRSSRAEMDGTRVHVPGDRPRGTQVLEGRLDDVINVPQDIVEGLQALGRGELSGLSSNPLFN